MGNFLTYAKLAFNMLPLIIQVVSAIEAAMPESGQGAKKLEMVKASLQHAYETANDLAVPFDTVWTMLSGVVASVVAHTTKK